jgi:integrase/recombinase XerD
MPEIPTITIFVRHSRSAGKLCKYADDESFRNCRCPKHLRWSIDGKQHRQSAKSRTWGGAEAERRRIEAGFAETGKAPATTDETKTIRSAIETFVASKRNDNLTPGVISKYELELGRLERFMSGRRKFLPKQIGLDDLISFRREWMESYPSSSTQHNVQARLRAFLRYCHDAGHIDRLLRLSPIKVDTEPVQPLTDAEFDKLLATSSISHPSSGLWRHPLQY